MYYICNENKGSDHLRNSAALFSQMQKSGFIMAWLNVLILLKIGPVQQNNKFVICFQKTSFLHMQKQRCRSAAQ